jgi:DNA-3-methyladenine glycosylase
MRQRRRRADLCNGPGKLTQALGVELSLDGHDVTRDPLTLREEEPPEGEIVSTTRIGISRGAELPYRYLVLGDPNVSVPPKSIVESGLRRAQRIY